jgi:predicted Zn-dependent protease
MLMHSKSEDATHGPLFEGRFSDGKSAAATDVHVRLSDHGIVIERPGTADPLVWPYGALATAEPLTQHAIDALITYPYMPGATLFVPEGTFARRLAQLAPHLTARAQRWSHARPWIWAAMLLLMVSGLIWMSNLSPSRAIARLLPDEAREKLGQQVVASMTDNRKICTASPGVDVLDKLVKRLTHASGQKRPFKVVVVDWSLLNAFATPGEQIVLTRGLINKAESADEVAGVIGHEMGHGIEMHPETGIVRAIGMSAAMELLVGGGGGTIGNVGMMLAQLSYTRDAEREADEHALRILREAKISPKGFGNFFRRIDAMEGKIPGAKTIGSVDILRTHPQTDERRRRVEGVPDYPATPALTSEEWQALREICGKDEPAADQDEGEKKI